jgi:hypothetical protein
MMTDDELLNSLNKIINNNLINDLRSSMVVKQGNTVTMFEKYLLKTTSSACLLERLTDGITINFSSLKNAVTWATFDNKSRISDCSRVLFLETILKGLDFDTILYEKYIKKTPSKDKKFTYLVKLQETRIKKRQLLQELEGYCYRAKRLQVAHFEKSSYK